MAYAGAYHVHGPASVIVAPGGPLANTSVTPVYLGVAERGVDISIQEHFKPVHTSLSGEMTPAEHIRQGIDATIRFRLAVYDQTVFNRLKQTKSVTASNGTIALNTLGVPEVPGTLVGTNTDAHRFTFVSAMNDVSWRFFHCILRRAMSAEHGTGNTIWDIEAFAWRYIPGTIVNPYDLLDGTKVPPLYDHSADVVA